jgi:hypothetical protein
MNIDDCYPSKYLKATDIGENKEVTVTIARVEIVPMKGDDGQSETKPVMFFRGKQKGMTLNMTNKNTIKKLYGPLTENWIGKSIRIGTSWVDSFGDQTLALRVRPIMPSPAPINGREPMPPRSNGTQWKAPMVTLPATSAPAQVAAEISEYHEDQWDGQPGDDQGDDPAF